MNGEMSDAAILTHHPCRCVYSATGNEFTKISVKMA